MVQLYRKDGIVRGFLQYIAIDKFIADFMLFFLSLRLTMGIWTVYLVQFDIPCASYYYLCADASAMAA